jgi:hypothetical protein
MYKNQSKKFNRVARCFNFSILLSAAWGMALTSGWAQPANDNFASALTLAGNTGAITGNNTGATKEAGEPDHVSLPGGKSVWYKWTAQVDGIISFDTIGSDFDTLLAIYTGASVGALNPVASNDDLDRTSSGSASSAWSARSRRRCRSTRKWRPPCRTT